LRRRAKALLRRCGSSKTLHAFAHHGLSDVRNGGQKARNIAHESNRQRSAFAHPTRSK
jgi:hypothetical protein